ncbi:ACT domain-containing protein [Nocardioides sp.]|uniref:glycine cleavage system protein R n=1 Tax=Nocardioides sp. TaxID=35761 RepID=UPI001D8A9052|nr:ACT domain-containing protein [Nocardioides sp.]MBU1801651.1 amino acid-binding ACT protein [Actinomycetota bacterium]
MASLVLTVIGDDRPGLVSAVSRQVEERGGSWQRSQMARLSGKFAGIALVEVPETAIAALEQSLGELAGLDVRVERIEHADAERDVVPLHLHLLGQDRAGIVAEISAALAARGVGIDELSTDVREAPMAGGTLFEVEARLSIPRSTSLGDVRADLERLADELMVDLDLGPAPAPGASGG